MGCLNFAVDVEDKIQRDVVGNIHIGNMFI